MAIIDVLKYGDPRLRQKTEKVEKVSAKIQKLVQDLFDTMYSMHGCGLAAPQVGVMKRIFVIDCGTDENPMRPITFINPVIIKKEGAVASFEGCLSFPEVYTEVKRYKKVTVRYRDLKGRMCELTADGDLLSRAIQHENDHLDGKLFVDVVIDAFEAEKQLKAQSLPPIETDKTLQFPEWDEAKEAGQVIHCM